MSDVISIRGPKNTGKTSLALSYPGIKYYYNLEFGFKRAYISTEDQKLTTVKTFSDENEGNLMLKNLTFTHNKGEVDGFIDQWFSFVKDYSTQVKNKDVDTIIIDTWKSAYTLVCNTHLQELQQESKLANKTVRKTLHPTEFRTPYTRMDAIIHAANIFEKTLILVSHERDVFRSILNTSTGKYEDVRTNEKELDGYRNTLDLVDWGFTTNTSIEKQESENTSKFIIGIEKSPVGINIMGLSREFENPSVRKLSNFIGIKNEQRTILPPS